MSVGRQLLKALYLDLMWMEGGWIWSVRDEEERITFETIEPLLGCPNLVEFSLLHDHPIVITEAQITTLTSKWSFLEVLNLTSSPTN